MKTRQSFVRLRHFRLDDLLRFNNINLDEWTEMYTNSFYLEYMVQHKAICFVAETLDGALAGYILAKMEGDLLEEAIESQSGRSPLTVSHWHSHISALSVAPEYRRSGVASVLMDKFEEVSELHRCWFADLFVRCSNQLAIQVYQKRGYKIYRRIKGYYSGQEDAFDMRRPLSRDTKQVSLANAGYSIAARDLYPDQDD